MKGGYLNEKISCGNQVGPRDSLESTIRGKRDFLSRDAPLEPPFKHFGNLMRLFRTNDTKDTLLKWRGQLIFRNIMQKI